MRRKGLIWQKRPNEYQRSCYARGAQKKKKRNCVNIPGQERGSCMAKETTHMAKETISYGKRDLMIGQKRPNDRTKET